jgi:hypothetical protein
MGKDIESFCLNHYKPIVFGIKQENLNSSIAFYQKIQLISVVWEGIIDPSKPYYSKRCQV